MNWFKREDFILKAVAFILALMLWAYVYFLDSMGPRYH